MDSKLSHTKSRKKFILLEIVVSWSSSNHAERHQILYNSSYRNIIHLPVKILLTILANLVELGILDFEIFCPIKTRIGHI